MSETSGAVARSETILGIVDSVTQAYLGAPCVAGEGRPSKTIPWTGSISIVGAWSGVLQLTCSQRFARAAAAAMFGNGPEAAQDDAAQDALSELTNIIGGNVKSLISQSTGSVCRLTLPVVTAGAHEPTARLVARVACVCKGEPVAIRLFSK